MTGVSISEPGSGSGFVGPASAIMPLPSGDTSGVTDAANYASVAAPVIASGGVVQMRPGRYYMAQTPMNPAVITQGVSVSLASGLPGTIITAPAGQAAGLHMTSMPNGNAVSGGFRDLTFDGGNGSNGAVQVQPNQFNGINIPGQLSRGIFERINVMNVPGDGFATAPGNSYAGTMIKQLRVFNPFLHGMNLQGSDFHLHDIEVYPPGLSAFWFNCVTCQASLLKSNFAGLRGSVGDTFGIRLDGSNNIIEGANMCQNDVGSFQTQAQTYTATNATPAVFTGSGAGFPLNTPVVLSGGTAPTGFTNGTVYYVVAPVGSTFELAATIGGAAIASTSTGNGTATPYNGVGVYITGSHNKVSATVSGSSYALCQLDAGATYNTVDIQTNNQQNATNAQSIYVISAASAKNNKLRIVGGATFLSGTYGLLTGSGTEVNNDVQIEGEVYGTQSVAFAATINPDPYLGGTLQIAALTGAITINNPVNGHAGTKITFRLTQNGTGGNVVTFGSNYKVSAAIPTTASTTTEIVFQCDAQGGTWHEVSRATA